MTLSSHIAYLKGNVFGRAIYPLSFITIAQIFLKLRRMEGGARIPLLFLTEGLCMLCFSVGSNLWPPTSQGHDSSCLHGGSVSRCSCVWQHFGPFWKKDLVLYQHWISSEYRLFSSVMNKMTNLVPKVKRRETLETRLQDDVMLPNSSCIEVVMWSEDTILRSLP